MLYGFFSFGVFSAASTSAWLQDIRHKFSEVLQVKAKRAQDALSATPIMADGYGGGAAMTYYVRD